MFIRKLLKYLEMLTLLLLVLAPNFACSFVGIRAGYEERSHKVVIEDSSYEIREYEPGLIAMTTTEGSFSGGQSESFGNLAGYIFGKNQEEQKIAMTVPVEMIRGTQQSDSSQESEDHWSMKFFLPKQYALEDLPLPNHPEKVKILPQEGELLAVRRFTWLLDESDLEKYEPQLLEWIEEQGYEATGEAKLAGYDPPWTLPFFRRNEVLIPVRKLQ